MSLHKQQPYASSSMTHEIADTKVTLERNPKTDGFLSATQKSRSDMQRMTHMNDPYE